MHLGEANLRSSSLPLPSLSSASQFSVANFLAFKLSWGFPSGTSGTVVKNPLAHAEMQEMCVQALSQEDLLEEETATHPSILAWKIPWTEEPGGPHPWGCKESDMTEHAHAG